MSAATRVDRRAAPPTRAAPPAAADPLRQRIQAVVDSIPSGSVASYGQVAQEAGLPRRARLVGRVLRELPPGTELCWHRVLGAQGRIRVEGAAAREQRRRLEREGVAFDARGRADLRRCRWRP